MRKILVVVAGVVVVALIDWATLRTAPPRPAATTQTSTHQADALAAVPRTPLAQAADAVQKGSVTVIDVRDVDSYIAGHIPGSLQIPLARVEGEVGYLPRGKPILTYCT